MLPTRPRRPRSPIGRGFMLAALLLPGCRPAETGPVRVVAIGAAPAMVNPDRDPVGPATALLLGTVAQGLVRFDATGEIEPGLAQSWIVSDDGRSYTFRLRRTTWARGQRVSAQQVVARLRGAVGRASRNPLKPVLGAIDQIEAMTDEVLEIRLVAPRPHFLQLLAQPELAIVARGEGTGPYRIEDEPAAAPAERALRLTPPPVDEEEEAPVRAAPDIHLSSAPAPVAVARFAGGAADFVTGGTLGDLPVLAAAGIDPNLVAFDPARGLFGLTFADGEGALSEAPLRQALAMAIDRDAIIARFGTPALAARTTMIPGGIGELPQPAAPVWQGLPMPQRRVEAARIVADAVKGGTLQLRVAVPAQPGYRIVFAHIRRDWRAIGVEATEVPATSQADLRMVDEVAPAELASWYLRHFICGASAVCDAAADTAIDGARVAPSPDERQALLAEADRALTAAGAFVPIAGPLRWSLRTPRLNGFRTNPFARHPPIELVQTRT